MGLHWTVEINTWIDRTEKQPPTSPYKYRENPRSPFSLSRAHSEESPQEKTLAWASEISPPKMVLSNDIDLLHPPADLEKRKHKLKRLVQSPNSFFMNDRVQSLPDRCGLWELPNSFVSADGRPGEAHGRLLFQEEGRLSIEYAGRPKAGGFGSKILAAAQA
ncbi:40S ribosomal protein S27-1 [Nymphaea thermarum]|nr:40S ribosomal protein S27-1 [Nymphaea thermarum]